MEMIQKILKASKVKGKINDKSCVRWRIQKYDVPKEDLIKALEDRGMIKEKIESELLRLKKAGELFEPRHGVLQKG